MMLDSLLLWCVKKKLCSNGALLYKSRSGCGWLPLDPLEVKVIVMKQNYNWELFVCLVTHFDLRQVASFWSQTSTCLSVADIWFYFSFVQEGFRYHQAIVYDVNVLDPWRALFAHCKRLSPWSWTLWSTVILMYITHVFVHFHLRVFLVLILMAVFFETWHTFHLYILINWSFLSTIYWWIFKQDAHRLAKQAWQFASTCQKKVILVFL